MLKLVGKVLDIVGPVADFAYSVFLMSIVALTCGCIIFWPYIIGSWLCHHEGYPWWLYLAAIVVNIGWIAAWTALVIKLVRRRRSIRARYRHISRSKWFKEAYEGKNLGETMEIDEKT